MCSRAYQYMYVVNFLNIIDSEIGVGSRSRSHDTSSDVTLQSSGSWGGLAPPTRVQPVPSDTVS